MRSLLFILLNIFCIYGVYCIETSNVTEGTSLSPTQLSSTTPVFVDNTTCEQHKDNCKECVANSDCYYCELDNGCHAIAMDTFMPDKSCPYNKKNIGTCKMNLMVVMILVGVGVFLLIVGVICICCCCCKRNGRIKLSKDDLKWARQREERRKRAEQQRQERAAKTDEIRRKYGLLLDASGLFKDDTPYQRFDA